MGQTQCRSDSDRQDMYSETINSRHGISDKEWHDITWRKILLEQHAKPKTFNACKGPSIALTNVYSV